MGNPETSATNPPPKREFSATTSDELATVVMRAQAFTSATGAAIALTDQDEMICRASSGTTAPDVGVHLSIEGSFTGMAVTSGQALRCDDSETDSRVDAEACRAMRTRSMCVVPVRDHGSVAGVLAVFSTNPNAFSDYHMAVLKTMADLISQSLARGRAREAAEPAAVEAAAGPKAVAAVSPATPAPKPVAVAAPKPVVVPAAVAPPAATPVAHAAAPAPAKTPAPAAKPKLEIATPIKASPAAPAKEPVREKSVKEKKEERITPARRVETKEAAVTVPSFGGERGSMFAETAPKTDAGGSKSMLLIGGGIAAVAVIGIVLWLALGRSSAAPKTAAASAAPVTAATTAPAPQPVTTSTAAIATTEPAAKAVETRESRRADNSVAEKTPAAKEEKPTPPPAPAPVMVAGGAVAKPAASDVAAPTLMPAGGGPALPALAGAAPAVPTLRVVTVAPRLVQRINPTYPLAAKQMGLHGTVSLEVKIDKRGNVSDVRPISGNAFFYEAAKTAIQQWKYKPQTVNGQPTDAVVMVTVNFEVPR